jgi:peptidoglycan/xylan/chitin deacetylase (PgdA/CDA1 family)
VRFRWPRVLMYHAITTLAHDPNMLTTTPDRFEAQMSYLKRRKLQGVSMGELHQAMTIDGARGMVGITFDDGYKDFLHAAMPILERFGFSATVFVVVGMLGKENAWQHTYAPRPRIKLLEDEELREVSNCGLEVGSHTMTHANLLDAEPELLRREVEGSRRMLSTVLGEAVQGFCFPFGCLDDVAVQAVRQAGYAYACGWRTRPERSVYDWPRIPVSDRDNAVRFAAKLKAYPQYANVKRRFGMKRC